MDNDITGTIFYDGRIIKNTVEEIQFVCDNPKFIKIKRHMTLEQLRSCIHRKLRLQSNQSITRIVNRLPQQPNVLCYMYHELVDDDDVDMMIFMFDNHTASNVIQLYVDYETVEADKDVQFGHPSHSVDVDISNVFSSSNLINTQQSLATMVSHWLNVGSSTVAESGGLRIRDIVLEYSSDNSKHEEIVVLDDESTNVTLESDFVALHRQFSKINLAALSSENRNVEVDNDGIWTLAKELHVRMQFDDKQRNMMTIRQYSVRKHQTFKVDTSDTQKLIVKCPRYGADYNWRVRVIHSKRPYMWQISKYDGHHNYLNLTLSLDHKKLDVEMICDHVMGMVQETPNLREKLIIERVRKDFGYNVLYRKAWQAKQLSIEKVFGGWDESYKILPRWLAAMRESTLGIVTILDTVNVVEGTKKFRSYFGPSDHVLGISTL